MRAGLVQTSWVEQAFKQEVSTQRIKRVLQSFRARLVGPDVKQDVDSHFVSLSIFSFRNFSVAHPSSTQHLPQESAVNSYVAFLAGPAPQVVTTRLGHPIQLALLNTYGK